MNNEIEQLSQDEKTRRAGIALAEYNRRMKGKRPIANDVEARRTVKNSPDYEQIKKDVVKSILGGG